VGVRSIDITDVTMRENIEDRIIAYFDGRISDDESADLLHRVSVSPEIRKLFREHEMLRELARSAQASTVVRPELEASLFSRIEALAAAEQAPLAVPVEEDRRRKAVPFFWSRWRLGLATAVGAFVLGAAITLGPELFDGGEDLNDQGTSNVTDAPALTPKDAISGSEEIAEEAKSPSKQDFNEIIRGDRDYEARQVANERPSAAGDKTYKSYKTDRSYTSQENSVGTTNIASTSTLADETFTQPISSVDARSSMPLYLGGEKGNMPVFRAEDIEQDEANFEMAVETSSGFSYPASGPGIQPFADPRISVGYFLDRQNIIGVRVTSGLFQALPEQHVTSSAAYTSISRNLEQERMFNAGAYYTHRFYGVLTDLMNLDASVGAGYVQSGGYTLTGELGLRLPFSSKLFGNISFALTRVHMYAPTMDEITNSVSVSDGPVLIEGSDVQNTINGRIHYGLSYQF
jgi:hypothetical protein